MPTYRCYFSVLSDLVLPPAASPLSYTCPNGYGFSFMNAPAGKDGHIPGLVAIVVGPAESLNLASETLRSVLAEKLDLLTFVSHSRFKIKEVQKVLEWEDGQKTRNFSVFHSTDARYPPAHGLNGEYLNVIQEFDSAELAGYLRRALRYFRYGLLEDQPEDQFVRLWLALEIVAVNTVAKDVEPQTVVCRICGEAALCKACGEPPPPVRSAKQAIITLATKVIGKSAPIVYKKLFDVRNSLMHGKSADSIEEEYGATWTQIINVLGKFIWEAILLSMPNEPPKPRPYLSFAGEFAPWTLVAAINGSFEHTDDSLHPSEDRIPNPEVTIVTEFDKHAPSG